MKKQFIWVCEACFKPDKQWIPMPHWGSHAESRKSAKAMLLRRTPEFGKAWFKKDGLLNARLFRFRKYIRLP